jgi:hypothetical protein
MDAAFAMDCGGVEARVHADRLEAGFATQWRRANGTGARFV